MSNLIIPKTNKVEQTMRDWIAKHNPNAIMINGYDHCITGLSKEGRVIYEVSDILKTLVGMEHSWDHNDAIEWFEYNIQGSFCDKENEPIFTSTSFTYDFID